MPTIPHVVGRSRSRLAWAAPVLVVGAVAAAAALTSATTSDASPTLPARTAAQLLTAVQQHTSTPLSGQLTETADLGIPSLPGDQSSASLSWQTFLTGSHSAKVWADGPTKQRVALLGQLSEADVTHNGKDLWTYTSETNSVSHVVLDAKHQRTGKADATPDATDLTPAQLSAKLLKSIDPTTAVSVDNATRVAGRAAYTLVLRPRDTRSTIHSVRIALDAKKYVPLRVQVYGAGSSPALEVGFTKVSFAKPAASVFAFTTPAGATVTTDPLGTRDRHGDHGEHRPTGTAKPSTNGAGGTTVIGKGWTSVLEVSGGAHGISLNNGMLDHLTTATGTAGQRLLHTALLNAVFRSDGRVFVGAVSPAELEHIAATH